MLSKESRIELRDKIIEEFKKLYVIIPVMNNNGSFFKISNRKRLDNTLNNNNKLKDNYNLYVSEFRSEVEAIYCLLHVDDFENHLCPICNNICKFYNMRHPYHKTCGNKKCISTFVTNDEVNEKRKQTNLKRYNTPYTFQNSEVQKKSKETMIKRYGVENIFSAPEFQEMSKKTCLKKYGCEHASQNPKVKEKNRQTCLERYNVDNVSRVEEFKEKGKQTCLQRFGYEHASQSPIIKEKVKNTNLERRGYEYPAQDPKVKEKYKQTCLQRFGYECALQNPIIKEKCKQTCLKNNDVEYPMQSLEIQEKSKQTCLEKYGKEYSTQNPIVQEKYRQTCLEKYGEDNVSKVIKFKEKRKETYLQKYRTKYATQKHIINYNIWDDNNKFKEFIINEYNNKKSFLLINEINGFFNVQYSTLRRKIEELDLLQYFYIQDSNLEIQFKELLDDNNITYTRHYRKSLYNEEKNSHQEIDFLINENIGIEINDIASHNSLQNSDGKYYCKDKYYHRDKSLLAKKDGIRIIHIWEWEMRDNELWNKTSKWILNFLNNNKVRIGARKCTIKEISIKEEKEFLNNYHLQGYMKSLKCYGLYYNNELVQIMSFSKPRYNKNYQWELLRLCTKYGYTVIGGAHKLLKNFINNNENSTSIISYCNFDKFNGKVYEDLGFKLLKRNEPQVTWCNKDMRHFSQSSLNMIGADKLLNVNYGKGTDNEEIVINHGYVPIFGCGLGVYLYNGGNI